MKDHVLPLHIAFTWYLIRATKKMVFFGVEKTAYPKNPVAYGTKSGGFYKLQIFKKLQKG